MGASTATATNGASGTTSSGGTTSTSTGASSSGAVAGCTVCSQMACPNSEPCLQVSSTEAYCGTPCDAGNMCATGFECAQYSGGGSSGGMGMACAPAPGTCSPVTMPGGSCATCDSTHPGSGQGVCQATTQGATSGECIEPCDSTGACLAGFVCESAKCLPKAGTCPSPSSSSGSTGGGNPNCFSCSTTVACPNEMACLTAGGAATGTCGAACATMTDCPTGFTCTVIGTSDHFYVPNTGTCP